MVGSLPSTMEVRAMAISSELIYLGCKGGIVEVWCRKKHIRVETLQTGTIGKVICMSLDSDEDALVIGTFDERIQVKNLFLLKLRYNLIILECSKFQTVLFGYLSFSFNDSNNMRNIFLLVCRHGN